MKNTLAKALPIAAMTLPVLALAQGAGGSGSLSWFQTLATDFGTLVSTLVPILIALAFLVFVWGLITFIVASGDEEAKAEGKRRMIWGVVALFVITSIWGILALLRGATGTDENDAQYPTWKIDNT